MDFHGAEKLLTNTDVDRDEKYIKKKLYNIYSVLYIAIAIQQTAAG